jgi:hypothetical protein
MKDLLAMLQAHPEAPPESREQLAETLEYLAVCSQACLLCADACLAEKNPLALGECIRTNLDCADICQTTSAMLLRVGDQWAVIQHAQIHACVVACDLCASQCAEHGRQHEHCRICAEICQRCQEKCNFLLGALSGQPVSGNY